MPQDKTFFTGVDDRSFLREKAAEILSAREQPTKFIEFFDENAVFHMIGRQCDYSLSGVFRGKDSILELIKRIDF